MVGSVVAVVLVVWRLGSRAAAALAAGRERTGKERRAGHRQAEEDKRPVEHSYSWSGREQ